jgi:hypothetical protein
MAAPKLKHNYVLMQWLNPSSVHIHGDKNGQPFDRLINAKRSLSKREQKEGTWTIQEIQG